MLRPLKNALRNTWLGQIHYRRREQKKLDDWEQRGRPVPPPPLLKQSVVRDYARRSQSHTLIETGTYLGDMLYATRDLFQKIYSIELGEDLHRGAVKRFARNPHITIVQGDSGKKLPEILKQVNEPCLFWLDGHYSAGITARDTLETPIAQELQHIFDHPVKTHYLLIDDAREFNGQHDYPTLDQLRTFCLSQRPNWVFEVQDDIVRFHPPLPA